MFTVTAVIPSKDRPLGVKALAEGLLRQDYPAEKLEIVVVDDGSDPAYSLAMERVRVIRHEKSLGAQRSRNEGVAAAKGEIIFMLDDDIEIVEGDYIRRAMEVFAAHAEAAAVVSSKIDVIRLMDGGERQIRFSTSSVRWYSGDLVNHAYPEGPVEWGHGIYFIRRAVLLELGGYDGIYGLNGGHSFREESDVQARLRKKGHRLWYLPEITIKHHIVQAGGHGASAKRRLYWIAHNHVVFLRRHIPLWRLRAAGFFLLDIPRYSWAQSRLYGMGSMVRGFFAGIQSARRDAEATPRR